MRAAFVSGWGVTDAYDRGRVASENAGDAAARSRALVGALAEQIVDVALPDAVIRLEQLVGIGAARAGDGEQRVEEEAFVVAGGVAARAAGEAVLRDGQHLARKLADGAAAERCQQRVARHLAAQCLALLVGPALDHVPGRVERRLVI